MRGSTIPTATVEILRLPVLSAPAYPCSELSPKSASLSSWYPMLLLHTSFRTVTGHPLRGLSPDTAACEHAGLLLHHSHGYFPHLRGKLIEAPAESLLSIRSMPLPLMGSSNMFPMLLLPVVSHTTGLFRIYVFFARRLTAGTSPSPMPRPYSLPSSRKPYTLLLTESAFSQTR